MHTFKNQTPQTRIRFDSWSISLFRPVRRVGFWNLLLLRTSCSFYHLFQELPSTLWNQTPSCLLVYFNGFVWEIVRFRKSKKMKKMGYFFEGKTKKCREKNSPTERQTYWEDDSSKFIPWSQIDDDWWIIIIQDSITSINFMLSFEVRIESKLLFHLMICSAITLDDFSALRLIFKLVCIVSLLLFKSSFVSVMTRERVILIIWTFLRELQSFAIFDHLFLRINKNKVVWLKSMTHIMMQTYDSSK